MNSSFFYFVMCEYLNSSVMWHFHSIDTWFLTLRKAWNLGRFFSHIAIVSFELSIKLTKGGYDFINASAWKGNKFKKYMNSYNHQSEKLGWNMPGLEVKSKIMGVLSKGLSKLDIIMYVTRV